MQKKSELPVLALDLGGTKIFAATISRQGQVMARERSLTLAREGPDIVLSRILSAIDHFLGQRNIKPSQLHSISVASAGAIDYKKGLVAQSANLPGWHDIPLRDIVQARYKVRTHLLNDADAAALGEHQFGAGRGVDTLVLLTLGTGIGGGVILNGRLYSGGSGSASEIGHMTIDVNGPRCGCGNTGCLEVLASGTAIAREATSRLKQGERSSLTGMVGGKIEDITAEKVSAAARAGDHLASEVIRQAATYLGVGLTNVVNIFNPEMIIIAGGLAKIGDPLLDPARQIIKERAYTVGGQAVRIVPAQLGDDAGVLGAAAFAWQQEPEPGEKV